MTSDDGLTLREISPSANTGFDTDVPADVLKDLTGDDRIQSVVNMGAYETLTPPAILFVNLNAVGANNGASWSDAFNNLQSALDAAVFGDQIWVAAGTYKPSKDIDGNNSPTDIRTKTFLLKNGVNIYGGFAGTETTVAERTKSTIAVNQTILSGDVNGNDAANFTNYNDNTYHIVVANGLTSATRFDGFIIKGANANLSGTFLGVSSGSQFGGGMFVNNAGANLEINNCIFTSNTTGFYAGGIYINSSSPTILNSVIEKNNSGFGGGLHMVSSFPTFINTVIANNTASYAGGLRNNSASVSTFINCTFFGNSGSTQGGAISNVNGSSAHLKNCIVWGNISPDGPALYNSGGASTVTYSNVQGGYTGVGNINADPIFSGPNDLDGADNKWMTADDGLTLREISASANTGINTDVPTGIDEDITGDDRIQSVVNMGAYELLTPSATFFVNANAAGSDNGSSWLNAYTNLQSALDAAVRGDEIWVAAGTYKPSKDIDGNSTPTDVRTKTFLLKNGVKMYGGFAGTETTLAERTKSTMAVNQTILSGDVNGNDAANFTNYNDNTYHILVANGLTSATRFDGFIIKGANANLSGEFLGVSSGSQFGGGMFINNAGANLEINNCIFTSNTTGFYAGGIYINSSSPTIRNSVIANNKSSFGGGLHMANAFPTFINTVIANNSASYAGGLRNNSASVSTFINCTFFGNSGSTQGGAISNVNGSSAHLKNCIVWGNTSPDGPALYNSGGASTVTYSNVQGGYSGTGNIDTDPLFNSIADLDGADDLWMTADDGLAFLSGSPSANTGNNSDVSNIDWDIVGDMRILDINVNMGAYESLGKTTPSMAWSSPTAIVYGTTLDATQLNASSNIAGTITYFTDATKTTNASGALLSAGTHSLYAVVNPTDAATYNTMQAIVSITVGKAAITVSADEVGKTYGDVDPTLTYTITSGALIGSDAFSGSLARTTGEDVGAYAINQNSLTLSSDYELTYVSKSLTISERPITVTALAKSKEYGDADPALTYSIISGSLAYTDTFTGSLDRAAGEDLGAYSINLNTLALNSNYAITYVSKNLTITKRAITVTANPKWKEYGETDPELTYSITSGSLLNTDAFSGALSRVTGEALGEFSIEQNTLSLGSYYDLTFVPASLTIEKRTITVGADAVSKIYGENDPSLTYTITSGSLLDGDEFTGVLEREVGEDAGEYQIAQNTLAANANYEVTFVPGTFTISQRAITVTADATLKTYGESDPALEYSITSGTLVNGDAFTGSLNRNVGQNVGTYDINQNSLALNANYTLTYIPTLFTIEPKAITVTANTASKIYGEADPILNYSITSGSLVNGDEFTGALTRENGENVGNYSITQNTLALDSNYDLTYIANDLTITERSITVTVIGKSKQYGDTDPELTYEITSGSLAGNDAFSGSLNRVSGETTGTYDIQQNTLSLNNNYSLTFIPNKLTITHRPINVTIDSKSKLYGESDPELTYAITSGSLVNGDVFTGVIERVVGENVGNYNIQQHTLALNANYDLTIVQNNFTIAPRQITVTAAAKSKSYGDEDPALNYSVSTGSLVNGDEFTGSINREAGENVGSYGIIQNTLTLNNNYDLTFVSSPFTITQRAITVTAETASKIYGNADPALVYNITSGSLFDSDVITGSIEREPGENVGSYAIVKNTLSINSNYVITFVSNNLTIESRPLAIKADASSKTFGSIDPAFTYTITSGNLLHGDVLTGTLSREAGVNAGVYAISKGTVTAGDNYSITFEGANFTINKATQEITFPELQDVEFGQVPFALHAETSSGLAVIYSSSDPNVAVVDGNTITIVGIGTTTITAIQQGNINYLSAVAVERTLAVKGSAATVDQTSISFGQVSVDQQASKTVTLTNTGNAELKILGATYPTGYTGELSSTTLAPGATATIEVTFSPTEARTYSGTIELVLNTPEGKLLIETTGEGLNVTSTEVPLEKLMTVSPNPVQDVLTINFVSSNDVAVLRMNDVKGTPVTLSFEKVKKGMYSVNVVSLKAGIYFVTMNDGKQIVTKRFVKL
jgi:hypothetical protein